MVEETQYLARGGRRRLALCLSGGGFRATLFHLGVIRRLHEVGLLARVDTISSVSGGSIMAAFLADRALELGGVAAIADFERDLAAPLRRFTSRDLRTAPILRHLLWSWATPGPLARAMVERFRRRLSQRRLAELPERPRFVLCATDVVFGVGWTFTRERVGDWQVGYAPTPQDLPLAFAVAASACFPPVFGPLPVDLPAESFRRGAYTGANRDRLLAGLALTDGGVYDNLGLEPALRGHDVVIASDAGGPFPFAITRMPVRRQLRYPSLVMKQVAALRRRQLMALIAGDPERCDLSEAPGCRAARLAERCPHSADPRCRDHRPIHRLTRGAYLAITNDVASEASPGEGLTGYSRSLVAGALAGIRTDLDRFTAAEAAILENHGYLVAAAGLRRHLPELLPSVEPPVEAPHPQWLEPGRAARALATSHRRLDLRRMLGRDPR